jgi:hypothetical protein
LQRQLGEMLEQALITVGSGANASLPAAQGSARGGGGGDGGGVSWAMREVLADAVAESARRLANVGECARAQQPAAPSLSPATLRGGGGGGATTGAGEDNGIGHDKNCLRFTYDSTFLRSQYLHPHPFRCCPQIWRSGGIRSRQPLSGARRAWGGIARLLLPGWACIAATRRRRPTTGSWRGAGPAAAATACATWR